MQSETRHFSDHRDSSNDENVSRASASLFAINPEEVLPGSRLDRLERGDRGFQARRYRGEFRVIVKLVDGGRGRRFKRREDCYIHRRAERVARNVSLGYETLERLN